MRLDVPHPSPALVGTAVRGRGAWGRARRRVGAGSPCHHVCTCQKTKKHRKHISCACQKLYQQVYHRRKACCHCRWPRQCPRMGVRGSRLQLLPPLPRRRLATFERIQRQNPAWHWQRGAPVAITKPGAMLRETINVVVENKTEHATCKCAGVRCIAWSWRYCMVLGDSPTQNRLSRGTDRISSSLRSLEYRKESVFMPNFKCGG